MSRRMRIALLIESSRAYGRGLLRGIAAYAIRAQWALFHQDRGLSEDVPHWLQDWHGDGIIARLDSQHLVRKIKEKGLPTVDLRGAYHVEGVPTINSHQQAVARMAADHLLERNFQHFAFCGFAGVDYSEQRCLHFVEYLAGQGYQVSVYENPWRRRAASTPDTEAKALLAERSLGEWLRQLPKPVGLMASNDIRAQQVMRVCAEQGISIPDEVAVIGVDNDDLLCELCSPSLSSVEPDTKTIGYNAAALLNEMLQGRVPPAEAPPVYPLRVVARQSTDVVAIAEADVAAAVRFIREHACEGIAVHDVLDHVQVSRSTLARRFRMYVGRSAKAEILRVRLQRVQQLLRSTNCSLAEIAELTGFGYPANLSNAFWHETGQTPGQYRTRHRAISSNVPSAVSTTRHDS